MTGQIPNLPEGCKPFGDAAKSVLLRCIVNADSPSDQKSFILTAYDSGLFSVAETFAWIAALNLASE